MDNPEDKPGHQPEPAPLPLDLAELASARRRGCVAFGAAVVVGAAIGGIVALFAGQTPALVTAGVVIVSLTFLAWVSGRRRITLDGDRVVSKALGTKSVDLRHVDKIELMVTDIRGTRTVGVLLTGGRTSINLALAIYSGAGGRELGILVLRRLADVLARSENTAGLVFSQLLVAQLRAEAKGDVAADRPLYRLAALVPTGRVAQRVKPEAVTRFVASLD